MGLSGPSKDFLRSEGMSTLATMFSSQSNLTKAEGFSSLPRAEDLDIEDIPALGMDWER